MTKITNLYNIPQQPSYSIRTTPIRQITRLDKLSKVFVGFEHWFKYFCLAKATTFKVVQRK